MEKNTITSIRYQLNDALNGPRQCVSVYFLFEGKPTERLIYFRKKDSFNYLKEAQKIIERELANGKLVKYAKKYHDTKVHNHLALKIITPVLAIAAFSSAGIYTYERMTYQEYAKGEKVEVDCTATDSEGKAHHITLSNEKAVVGKDYITDITLEDNSSTYALPRHLNQVVSLDSVVTEENYDYDRGELTKARLAIPAKYVEGPVKINLTVQSVEYGVTMDVATLSHCTVSYEGVELSQGQKVQNILLENITLTCTAHPGYTINDGVDSSFNIKYEDGKKVEYTYDASTNILEIKNIRDNFTFEVAAKNPEGAVEVTVDYNDNCSGIYYHTDNTEVKLLKGKPFPVTQNDIEDITFMVDTKSTNLTINEISCDLVGAKLSVKKIIGNHNYEIIVNCAQILTLSNFSLSVHPGEYNAIDVNIDVEYCEIKYKGQKVESEASVVPEMTDQGLTITFEAETEGTPLDESKVDCKGLSGCSRYVEHIIGDRYTIKIIASYFETFTLKVNPAEPLTSVKAKVENNEHCTVTYKGLALSNEEFDVVPLQEDRGGTLYDAVTFKVTTDGTPFSANNVWSTFGQVVVNEINDSPQIFEVSVETKHNDKQFVDFTIKIKPGETKGISATIVYSDKPGEGGCVAYYGGSETPLIINKTIEVKLTSSHELVFDVETEPGYYFDKSGFWVDYHGDIQGRILESQLNVYRMYGNRFRAAAFNNVGSNFRDLVVTFKAKPAKTINVSAKRNDDCTSIKYEGVEMSTSKATPIEILDKTLKFAVTTTHGAIFNISKITISQVTTGKIKPKSVERIKQSEDGDLYDVVIEADTMDDFQDFTFFINPTMPE